MTAASLDSSVAPRRKRQASTTQQLRNDIKDLIHELKQACRRPLYEEIVGAVSDRTQDESDAAAGG